MMIVYVSSVHCSHHSQSGQTVLMKASEGDNLSVVEQLIEKGAGVNKEDEVCHNLF